MSIYVDPLIDYGWKLGPSCHMFTDGDIEQLHLFAESIGLKRSWLDNKKGTPIPHYDLVANKRKMAAAKEGEHYPGRYPGTYWQPLFDLMSQEHGLLLLDSELNDIADVVNKMQGREAVEGQTALGNHTEDHWKPLKRH